MSSPRWLRPVLVLIVLAWFLQGVGVELLVDKLWFDSLGYPQVFERMLATRVALWVGTFACAAALVAINLRHAVRAAPLDLVRLDRLLAEVQPGTRRLQSVVRVALGAAVVIPALLLSAMAGGLWPELLAFIGRQPFGQVDPVFGLDLGFYVFTLPLLESVRALAMAGLFLTALPVGGWYLLRDVLVAERGFGLSEAGRRHALVLAALGVLLSGAGTLIERYGVLSQQHGVVWGAGYADIVARLPGMLGVALLGLVVAGGLIYSTRRRGWSVPVSLLVGWFVLRGIALGVLPDTVQDWVVAPNELAVEADYLERNIQATREAYALDRIEVKPFEAAADLTLADLQANPETVDNIRVWDNRPLLTTYGQLQEIRLYYDFVDVDIDRYMVDGAPRQVMLSARELNASNLPSQARSWVNEHLQFTHGYGLTMSPVNMVTQEGLPDLVIRDLPPVIEEPFATAGLQVDRPEIYYGELTDRYVFVRTTAQEFDYPKGDENVYATYAGDGGVPIDSLWKKALFSAWFGSLDVLLSQYLVPESRVMFRRNVAERVRHLAPFLHFDRDPYLVVDGGRLYWFIDGYTTASRYPYSEPFDTQAAPGGRRFNYMRNSVKAVVDAYDGRVRLYVADASDPVIRAWATVLPDTFLSMEQMPAGQLAHLRYPVDFFSVQVAMYRAYHMTDTTVFYNKEDMWALPREQYEQKEQQMEPYYLIMKLPGEEEAEFILLVPFVPTNRDNMISWLAARCDPEHYGKLVLYRFPKNKLIYGPRQIESRIDQDPVISQEITLWGQSGSRVVRGNLLVVPIEDSLLYVEPLYLQAESSQLPELKRVIVSYENRIAMEETLEESLARIFGEDTGGGAQPAPGGTAGEDGGEGQGATNGAPWASLAARAQAELDRAQAAQRAGDWAGYGEALQRLEETLRALAAEARDGVPADAEVPLAPELVEGAPPPSLLEAGAER